MAKRPNKQGVGHRIEIAAPAEAVWRVVADLGRWGEWNPLYIQARGAAEVGSRLVMTVALEGMKPQKASAVVTTAEAARLLEYEIVSLGGLVRTFRVIEIEPFDPGSCAVTNAEIMTGLLGGLIARSLGDKVRNGLQAMNESLKARAEAG